MRGKEKRRVLAAVLSFSMLVSGLSVPAGASAASKKGGALTEQALKRKLASAVSSTEYPKGMIAFGES